MASEQLVDDRNARVMGPITREEAAQGWAKTAEGLLKGLPPPSIQPLPVEHASDLSKYTHQLGISAAEAWQKCADAMRKYDADSCRAYREEIDTLLVFAGLFSAVVTAFTIESYQWLQSDPNDVIIALLSQIAHPQNESQVLSAPNALPDAVSTRINIYWFLSLALSLSAALTAILCKQWVREFERHADQSHEQFIRVRQMKLEGFEMWGVAAIVATVPLLLQSALGLFAVGVIELLWTLHRTVAIVVLVPTAAAFVFYALTTLLPGLQAVCSPFKRLRRIAQCPFKSPQAILTLRLCVHVPLLLLIYVVIIGLSSELLAGFLHRKCLVFWRRVRTYWNPELLPPLPNEAAAHSMWNRLIRPWQFEERTYYQKYTEEPTWNDVGRWLRKVWRAVSSCGQDQDANGDAPESTNTSTISYDQDLRFPTFDSMESWLTLDLEFTRLRDVAYTPDEYQKTIYDEWAVPPSFCFTGFSWLREHVNVPGIGRWIWLCVWDMAVRVEESDAMLEVDVLRIRRGILDIGHFATQGVPGTSTPCAMALLYGLRADMEPVFVAEALIHRLPTIEPEISSRIYDWIIEKLGEDRAWMSSVLHAILSLPLASAGDIWASPIGQEICPLLLTAARESDDYRGVASQRELACIIALYYRELLAHGARSSTVSEEQNLLLIAAIRTHLMQDGAAPPAEEWAVFAALARDVDREFERLREHGPRENNLDWWEWPSYLRDYSAVDVARSLMRDAYRPIYLDLLSDGARDDTGEIEQRFLRNIVLSPQWHQYRPSGPRAAPAGESSAPAQTSDIQESASPISAIQVYPPVPETDESPSSAGLCTASQDALHATGAAQIDSSELQIVEPAGTCAGQEGTCLDAREDICAQSAAPDDAGAGEVSQAVHEVPGHV